MIKHISLVVMLTALSGVASAKDSCKTKEFFGFPVEVCAPGDADRDGSSREDRDRDRDHDHDHDARPTAAPELDSASAMAGLTLALGGMAVLLSRRFKNPTA